MADFRHRLSAVISRVSHPGILFATAEDSGRFHLRVEADALECSVSGKPTIQAGRWWRLSTHMTDGEIAQTALMAVLSFNEHEVREQFKVDGVAVFGPHFDLDYLVQMASSPVAIQERARA